MPSNTSSTGAPVAARHLPGLLRRVLLPYKHALALVDDAQLLAVVHAARPSQSDTSPTEITSYQPSTSTFAIPFPRAYPSAASSVQTSIPRPLSCCSPHLAAHLVSNISLPSAALTAARFRHPPRSSVEPQPHVSVASVDSHIACIPALPSGALQSCPRVLDMNIIRNPRCEERPAVVSKGDSRRSLFGSFDICAASV